MPDNEKQIRNLIERWAGGEQLQRRADHQQAPDDAHDNLAELRPQQADGKPHRRRWPRINQNLDAVTPDTALVLLAGQRFVRGLAWPRVPSACSR